MIARLGSRTSLLAIARQIRVLGPNGEAQTVDGANRDRTGDLLLAKQALSQLSYGPWVSQYTRCSPGFRLPAGPGHVGSGARRYPAAACRCLDQRPERARPRVYSRADGRP